MSRLLARMAALEALLVLAGCGVAACSPTPANSAKSPTGPATASQASPIVTPNPFKLEPNDCTAPPPSNGTQVHSPMLGATVTLPAGWAEDPTMEGQQGMQVPLYLSFGTRPNHAFFTGDLFPSTMSPHDLINWMAAQPGSGTVVAKGDCTIAGGKAAFFESTISMSAFPGITISSDGYGLIIGHRDKLVYLDILFPSGSDTLVTPQVKSILGSWQWDQPGL